MSRQVELNTEQLTQEESTRQLIRTVKELIGYPLSSWAVAATIESIGVRDVDVKPDYGFDNVFELADFVYQHIKEEVQQEHQAQEPEVFIKSFSESTWFFIKHYSQGLVLALPMLLQIIAIIMFGYALWAWLKFNETQATVVAFGTIGAFVVTGGFIQVIGRLVSKYKGEENYYLAGKATVGVIKLAVPCVLVFAGAVYLINVAFPFYPQPMIIISLIYFLLISGLLLSAAVLFATELRFMILFSVLTGTGFVIISMYTLPIGIYASQWIGIVVAILLMSLYGYLFYKIKISSLRQGLIRQTLPDSEVSYFNNYRYFVYGFCYFLFLFTDRIMAWSAGPPPPPYIIWFNTPYELGMDWALISFVISIAVLEFCVHSFSDYLIPAQENMLIRNTRAFNRYFSSFYKRQLFIVLIVSVISILCTYYGVLSIRAFQNEVPEIRDFFANSMTYRVFWMASIGYVFLIYGLMNSLFFFTLNRPEFVIYSIIGSLFVNGIVGYVCSRLFGLEYAAIGLIVGSLTFAVVTWGFAKRFFRHLDYYYYSAY